MKVAVLIPCYNEATTIKDVIVDFNKFLPNADVYVYDNNSSDNTAEIAEKNGAIVRKVKDRGKGNVVRRMFADVEADVYVMVDGDSTYNVKDANKMIKTLIDGQLDMVIAARHEKSTKVYREGHKFGNLFFNKILKILFNSTFNDIFSGFRVFSKRFVKTFPVMSKEFDIEAELSIHALTLSLPCEEIESAYFERPKNSFSKLSTFKDGFKILFSIIKLLKETRPAFFFGALALIMLISAAVVAYPAVFNILETGRSEDFHGAFLCVILTLLSFLSMTCGAVLDSVCQARMEMKMMNYKFYNICKR